MALKKQARELSKNDIKDCIRYLKSTRYPIRNKVIFCLSVFAGLRAVEISKLDWSYIIDQKGSVAQKLSIHNKSSKGKSGGRIVPMAPELRSALIDLAKQTENLQGYAILSKKGGNMSAKSLSNLFDSWYKDLGLLGCSSHSGRVTFANTLKRRSLSVHQIQIYLGHSALSTTQQYFVTKGYDDDLRAVTGLYDDRSFINRLTNIFF